jgi:PAS domain S-box-containing protein
VLGLSRHLSIRLQLLGLFALVLASAVAVLLLDEAERRDNARVVDQLREESMRSLRQAKAMSDAYGLDIVGTTFRVRNDLLSWEEGVRNVDNAREKIEQNWAVLAAAPHTQVQREMLSRIRQARRPADDAAAQLRDILVRRDGKAIGVFADTVLFPAMDPLQKRLKALSDLQLIEADKRVRASQQRAREASLTRLALTGAGLLLMALLAANMVRNIYRGVESLRDLSSRMRKRDYEARPRFHPRGELGQVMDSFLAMRDDVRHSQGELLQSEVFQRSLLEAAQVAVVSLDMAGRITSFNPFAEKLTGYGAAEVSGRRGLQHLMLPAELERVAGQLSLALGRTVPADSHLLPLMVELELPAREFTLVRKDGSQVPVLVGTSPMRGDDGATVGYLAVGTDMTHVKLLEQRLRASEAAAREASLAKSSFLAVMSHEIRTPMIGITGMLEVLSHSTLDPEQRRTIHVIQQSSTSLLRIVGDILDFSKVEAGRIELSPTTLSLRALLQSVLANFAGASSSKGLLLHLRVDAKVAPAHVADGLRLRQILANFLSNAVKFTERGTIELVLEHLGVADDRERLRFQVVDSGIGVSAEQQARLFQAFSQAEGSTTRRFGGTGLGLVISRRLAELMGGQVLMHSEPGVGTTVSLLLDLPIGSEADLEEDETGSATALPAFVPRPLPSVAQAEAERSLVLIVDDHPTNRLVIGRQLALAGYASETAGDGEAGLRALAGGRFALVLSDVHMPIMDGYQMTQTWRAEEERRQLARTPIVALTAAAHAGEAERCLAAGMDDFLAKPVTIPAMAACLGKWLPHTARADDESLPDAAALPQASTPPLPLQPGVVELLTSGDRGAAAAILQDFLGATADDLVQLQRARAGGDAPGLLRQAHRISGSARLVGAQELAEAAGHLEQAARGGDWAEVLPAATDLQTAAERLRLYIEGEYLA